MGRKIRKIIDGEVQWFGSPMLEIKDEASYIESYKYRIYNLLNIIKGEIKDKNYGISGVFKKQTKEETDIEIQEALRTKLDLTVNSYNSYLKDREYHCDFTVTTPKGIIISLEEVL